MLRGTERIFALDIGANSIKAGIFTSQRKSGLELIRFATRDFGADPSATEDESARLAKLTAMVKDIMSEIGVTGGPVLMSVAGQSVFSRFVKLPPVSREKVLQIVRYEAQQNVPFPIDDVVWDYQLVGAGAGEIDVMLAAIKKEMIEGITGAVAAAGLQPELVDVSPMALYNIVRYSYPELPPCTLVIDIGARSTDLIFIEANRVFNRSIAVGGNAITQQIQKEFDLPWDVAEKLKREHAFVALGGAYEAPPSETADKVSKTVRSVMTRLHSEISRSINFYHTQQSGSHPGMILLTGGSSIISHTDTFLKEKLRIEVDYLNPFSNVAVSNSINANEIGSQAHLMGEVVGLALRRTLTCPIELNLLPPSYIKEETFHRRVPMLIASMVVIVAVAAVWWLFFSKRASLAEQRLERIEARVDSLEKVNRDMQGVQAEINALNEKCRRLTALPLRRARWIKIIDEIYSKVPQGMWILKINPYRATATGPGGVEGGGVSAPPMGFGAAPAAPTPAAALPSTAVDALELTGFAYMDKVALGTPGQADDGLLKFRDDLRASPLFDDTKTDLDKLPQPARDDFVREFTIKAVLTTPVDL